MEKAVEVIVNLAQVWGCQSSVGSR